MLELHHPIGSISGIGPKTAEALHHHGIRTIEDLLYFFPRAWMNASTVTPVAELVIGVSRLVQVRVVQVKEGYSQKSRLPYLRALVADTSGAIEVLWFHPRFIRDKVRVGADLLLFGKLQGWRRDQASMVSPKFMTKPCILPIYPEIGGLPQHKFLAVFSQIKALAHTLPDYLPERDRVAFNVVSEADAVCGMHFPNTLDDVAKAKDRLALDELLLTIYPSLVAQQERAKETIDALVIDNARVTAWLHSLPFSPTSDQQQAIIDIMHDLTQPVPMNRLVQGDVGSGKTLVALAGALATITSGKQVVWLAPTELLARQHYETAKKLLSEVRSGVWTRTHKLQTRNGYDEKLTPTQLQEIPLIIGTHALLSEKLTFRNLGLLIIDEQHRFGVKQRAQLRLFSGKPIHLLSMTATPIPRTMALLLYSDLVPSAIREKPPGRQPITTRVVTETNRGKAYAFVEQHLAAGGQAYVVCPSIEPTEIADANLYVDLFQSVEEKKAVTTWAKELEKHFPNRRIGVLHGKMKSAEKEAVMQKFREGAYDILVSTTVVEVGVDVPNANIMMIENAERFGLAQLHQLRGRVGRGSRASFCFLFPSHSKAAESARLTFMEETNDGFELAQRDLELRGPGELTGVSQSGLPSFRFASLQDVHKIEQVKALAASLLDNQQFKTSFARFYRFYHPE